MAPTGEGQPDRPFGRVEAALDEALAKEGPEREAFLGSLEDEPGLAAEVKALLAHVDTGRSWFQGAARWLRPARPTPPPPPAIDPLVGASFQKYEVVGVLGRGGMGVVYQARDTQLDRMCALKFLALNPEAGPEERDRLVHEARAVAALDHPNICTIYDVGEADDGRLFLAMPHYDGQTLKGILASGAPLPKALCANVALQLARGLSVAHAAGIVHRDVKPANVMVTGRGVVKILDFGVAVREGRSARGVPRPAGTLAYMSPEQLAAVEIDHRADLWGLGVVLWEMLTGQKPFAGESTVELIDAIDLEPPELPSPNAVEPARGPLLDLARRLMAKDIDDRPTHADEVVGVLGDYLKANAGAEEPDGGGTHVWPLIHESLAGVDGGSGDPGFSEDSRSWSGSFGRSLRNLALLVVATWMVGSAVRGSLTGGEADPPVALHTFEIPSVGSYTTWSWIALSPDGRRLVYQAPRGEPLRIRNLETGVDGPLPGTEGGRAPFFSPDGNRVGFVRGRALLAADVSGGAPQVMLEPTPFWTQNTWVSDDEIIGAHVLDGLYRFSLGQEGKVVRVERLTSVAEMGHTTQAHPRSIPGSGAALFQFGYPGAAGSMLGVIDLGSGEAEVLGNGGHAPRYGKGHVIYAAFDELWALPFDTDALEATGPSQALGIPVNWRTNGIDFDVTQGGRLAYIQPHAFEGRLVLVQRDGSQRRIAGIRETFRDPRFSPTGHRVAYATQPPVGGWRLWVLDPESGQLTGLQHDANSGDPRWSEGGDSLFYSTLVPESGGNVVYKAAADGSGDKRLVLGASRRIEDVSTEGRWVLYRNAATRSLRSRDLVSGQDLMITATASQHGASLSPGARYVAYPMMTEDGEYLAVGSFPGDASTTQVLVGRGFEPRWGSGGSALYYRDGTHLIALSVDTTAATFTVTARDTLFQDRWQRTSGYDVHPDGQSFVFVEAREDSATVVVRDLPLGPGSS